VIEDLTVLHRPQATGLIRERLITVREIHNGQTCIDHSESAVQVQSGAIGPAMMELSRHFEQGRASCPRASIHPRNATHGGRIRAQLPPHA
jgi:hypothetical protein